MLAFKDSADGYYEFADDAPPEWYVGLTPTALRPPSPPAIPQSVTRFQARAALSRAGLFTTVNSAMVAFPIDDERRLAWEDAQEFRRTSPTMLQMASALGLTDAQLDELFTTAAGIEA